MNKETLKQIVRPAIRNFRTAYQILKRTKFRYDLVNELIQKHQYKSYLEIGVQDGYTLRAVKCLKKAGVDPAPRVKEVPNSQIHLMTSDAFFAQNQESFDLIFIDGLHTHEQSLIDFKNAEKVLNPGGSIVFHDSNPKNAEYAKSHLEGGLWSGDVFKTIVLLNSTGKYHIQTLDIDCGCAVVQMGGRQKPFECELSYDWFAAHRKQAVNLTTWSEYFK